MKERIIKQRGRSAVYLTAYDGGEIKIAQDKFGRAFTPYWNVEAAEIHNSIMDKHIDHDDTYWVDGEHFYCDDDFNGWLPLPKMEVTE